MVTRYDDGRQCLRQAVERRLRSRLSGHAHVIEEAVAHGLHRAYVEGVPAQFAEHRAFSRGLRWGIREANRERRESRAGGRECCCRCQPERHHHEDHERVEDTEDLRRAVQRLSPWHRRVLDARYVEALTWEQVAERLCVGRRTAIRQHDEAVALLRSALTCH